MDCDPGGANSADTLARSFRPRKTWRFQEGKQFAEQDFTSFENFARTRLLRNSELWVGFCQHEHGTNSVRLKKYTVGEELD